jgi:hypothetical protein
MFIKNLFKELDAKLKGRQVKKFAKWSVKRKIRLDLGEC